MGQVNRAAAMLAVVALSGCAQKQAPTALLSTQPSGGASAGSLEDAAFEAINCSLKVYYTAPQPMTPEQAVAACPEEVARYRAAEFARNQIPVHSARTARQDLERQLAEELKDQIARHGAREARL